MPTFLAKADNAKTQVQDNPLTAGALSINVSVGTGAKFPSASQFVVTIWDSVTYEDPGDDPNMEKVLCDSTSGDVITVNTSGRGYDGTIAVEHAQDSACALLVIKKHFDELEAAIPDKAAGTDIDTGTDDAKFVTAKAIADSYLKHKDGWYDFSGITFERVSTQSIKALSVDLTGVVGNMDKLYILNNGSPLVFYVKDTSLSGSDTIFTLAGETDIAVGVPTAADAVTGVKYSHAESPVGFKDGRYWYNARVRSSVVSSIASGAYSPLLLDTAIEDRNGNIAANKYTAPISGKYILLGRGQIYYGSLGVETQIDTFTSITVDAVLNQGTGTRLGLASTTLDAGFTNTDAQAELFLDKGAEVEIHQYQQNGLTANVDAIAYLDIQFLHV